MNGVTGSVLHTLKHLADQGHQSLVIAPKAGEVTADLHGAHTRLLRSVPLPSYPDVRVVFARAARLGGLLREFDPDVVHLASPFVLGWQALAAADALRLPTVAVYQTDIVSYAQRYGVPRAASLAALHTARLHRRATLTLAPSRAAADQLAGLGVDRVRRWGRGVDAERFRPERRSEAWRAQHARGSLVVGYVGRLAPEKQIEDLRVLHGVPGIRLVIVGDGPSRADLQRAMPDALFTGHLGGQELAEAMASFDVFVHPGESETFGQTIQEALACGVPVVATGVGGPVDLVRQSIDGWLYRPGDLADLRARVLDLVGDAAKRQAFAASARASVRTRTWAALGDQLIGHYDEARALRPIDDALPARATVRPERHAAAPAATQWSRYIALGDSLTEGLCDGSRMPQGSYRGWADRLAPLVAHEGGPRSFHYANLAVRSRRVQDVLEVQIPRALELRPDLVSVLIGSNDLVGHAADPVALARRLEAGIGMLRAAGIDVLLVTPFLPRRAAAKLFARRFAIYNSELRRIATATGARLLDLEALPAIGDLELWAADKVHLRPAGHRFVAYRAAEVLGVRDAEALGGLDEALHSDEDPFDPTGWLRRDALPWIWRRLHGRTAGDGVSAKHDDYVRIGDAGSPRPSAVEA